MFDIVSTISKAIKAISPGAADIYGVKDDMSVSDILDVVAGSIDPLRAAKNLNLEVQASKSIAYYPVFVSNSLSPNTVHIITKSLERRIAEMIRLVISRNDFIDLKVANKEDVIEQFRGQLFKGEWDKQSEGKYSKFNESVNGLNYEYTLFLKENYQDVMGREMVPVTEMVGHGNLNLESTSLHLLEAKASGGNGKETPRERELKIRLQNVESRVSREYQEKLSNIKSEIASRVKQRDRDLQAKQNEQILKIKDDARKASEIDRRSMIIDSKKITKLNELEPTVIEVDVVYGTDGAMKSTTILLAIKCSVHVLESEEVAQEIARTIYDERPMFRAIQVFAGEISFWNDFVFNIDKVKPYYQSSLSTEAAMFNHLIQSGRSARRINVNGASKAVIIPTTTLVLTTEEVNRVRNICQEDLMNGKTAKKLMTILNIMNIIIIDEGTDAMYRFDHAMGKFEKTSLPKEKDDNKNDGLVKALSLALTRR